MENDTVAADQDAIKQLPPNIAKLKLVERKEWAKKLLPLVKDNTVIAMATFLKPKAVAGMRGYKEGRTSPPPPGGGKTRKSGGTEASKRETGGAKEGTEVQAAPSAEEIAKQVTEQLSKSLGDRLKKLEETVELELTERGNGGPRTVTSEEPGIELDLPGATMKVSLSPVTLVYFSETRKAMEENNIPPLGMSDFLNKTVAEFFQSRGYHFAMYRKQQVRFKEGGTGQ